MSNIKGSFHSDSQWISAWWSSLILSQQFETKVLWALDQTSPTTCCYVPGHGASPPLGRCQIILLGDRSTWVWTTYPELLPGNVTAGSRSLNAESDDLTSTPPCYQWSTGHHAWVTWVRILPSTMVENCFTRSLAHEYESGRNRPKRLWWFCVCCWSSSLSEHACWTLFFSSHSWYLTSSSSAYIQTNIPLHFSTYS